jgi:glycosyltransferase involved in cell wall biosynthesis
MTLLGSKKILLVISSLGGGGAERVMSALANAWADAGVQVGLLTLATAREDAYPLSPKVKRIVLNAMWESRSLWESMASTLRRCLMIRRAMREFGPDAVLSFMDKTNVITIMAIIGSGIPIVVSEHINPCRRDMGRVFNRLRRWVYPLARRVVVLTKDVADGWGRRLFSPGKVTVIPNFVRDGMPEALPDEARDPGLILAVGRLVPSKGFDALLAAFARSGLAGRGARLVILGEGPQREPLMRQAQMLGIAASVSLPGWAQDVESWMARCAVFVMLSRYEGFPMALLEAMAMGCAAVAADCDSGPREMIRHGHNGLLVPVDDETAAAQALTRLFEDAGLRASLGRAAVEVRERYSREAVMRQWEEVLLEAMGR